MSRNDYRPIALIRVMQTYPARHTAYLLTQPSWLAALLCLLP